MRNIITVIIIAISSAVAVEAASPQRHVINVGTFTELNVKHSVNVDYRSNPDSAGMATFVASADMVNVVMFRNNGKGKLQIELDIDPEQEQPLPTVVVYSRYLTKIENSGDSTVRAFSVNAGPKFTATLMGNGRLSIRDLETDEVNAKQLTGRGQIALSGNCRKASLSCTGAGAIQADDLHAVEVNVSVVGPVTVGCYVSERLSVKGMGTGKVYYAGHPRTIRNRSAGPKLIDMEQ